MRVTVMFNPFCLIDCPSRPGALCFGLLGVHARVQKVLLEGVQLCQRFTLEIPLKAGHHRSASETPFQWHFAGAPMMAQH